MERKQGTMYFMWAEIHGEKNMINCSLCGQQYMSIAVYVGRNICGENIVHCSLCGQEEYMGDKF
jgi:uncharacterized Zn-finger protein